MSIGRLVLALSVLANAGLCAEPKSKPQPEPKISSIYPAGAQRGTNFQAVIRGSDLAGAYRLIFEETGTEAQILGVDPEPPVPGESSKKDLVRLQVTVAPDAAL